MLAEDGSGKGAGLVSAIAQRINARNVCTPDEREYMSKVTNGIAKTMKEHELNTNGHHNGAIHSHGDSNGRC